MLRGANLSLAFVLVLAGAASATEIAGRIKTVEGSATVISGGVRSPAAVDGPVRTGDTIETGADGAVGITFSDSTRFSIGANSHVVIDDYVFSPREDDLSFVTRLKRGTLFYVSGMITKLAPEKTAIQTPDGTIGIRGTRLLVAVRDE